MYQIMFQVFKEFPSGAFLSQINKVIRRKKLFHFLNLDEPPNYMKIYRFFINNPDFYIVYRIDGMIFIEPKCAFFDLIKDYVKFKLTKPNIFDLPKKAHDLRIESIKIMQKINILNRDHKQKAIQNFNFYIDEVKNKVLCFLRTHPRPPYDVTLIMPYNTRFTKPDIKLKTLSRYENALETATLSHKKAVFLTLTTDPKKFESLWHANRHFSIAWNKFMSYLTSKKSGRPEYIAVYEYTKNTGLLHMHVIIFGCTWLASHKSITVEWEKCGQGTVNWEYQLHNDNGKWCWTHGHPKTDIDNNAGDYLKKYLKKAIFSNEHLELYWIFNKRFMTCSRRFTDPTDEATTTGIYWKFIGTWPLRDVPENIYNASNIYQLVSRSDYG